ncbi:MAG: hypothetical protein R2748_34400 [Bryobacterales bacterium]
MLGHMNQHAGQIAFLARHLGVATTGRRSPSRGGTKEFNAKMARKFGKG